jgi:hypothetical protein
MDTIRLPASYNPCGSENFGCAWIARHNRIEKQSMVHFKFLATALEDFLFTQLFQEFLHALGSTFLDLLDTPTGINGIGVNEVNWYLGTGIVQKTCCGINNQRSAYDNEDVSL